MESKPESKQLPVINIIGPTILANIASVDYGVNNGHFQLNLAEDRPVAGNTIQGIPQGSARAIVEVGRVTLTPRAVRMLLDSLEKAAKAFEDSTGQSLPTIDQFNARAAMTTLTPPQPPRSE